ncbi:ADP-ribosylglycohydrolase family protein [Amycolatopsis aidingensis]|uniref:ADP-ribosylglycohydrolase family protein n=1 Tax=Amycolatopsis aidingensis TaxID=2842453 RepID=UPI001C0DA595|nr:ADP-ribosylglycohydrolase family protein [Amycolatopsis aidingensis]
MSTTTMLDRAHGGLLGLAAGDALGATVEFRTPEQIAAEFGRHTEIIGGGTFRWRPGQGTDDTDMTAAVARAYVEGYTSHRVGKHFLDWYREGPRDIGNSTATALSTLAATGDPSSSGHAALATIGPNRAAGNGSLMRALPTALARNDQATRIREAAEISSITHADPRCVQACIAYVEIAAHLLDGHDAGEAINAVLNVPELDRDDVRQALRYPSATPVDELSTGGYVLDSLAAAVWAIQQPHPLEDTLIDIVNRGDDADTTGAIAGGLLGLRDGIHAIPTRWQTVLEYGPEFHTLANALLVVRIG